MSYTDYMRAMLHDDSSRSPDELMGDYARGIDELRAAVAGMTAEQVLLRPVPGKWSTLEVVAHLADSEVYFTDRIERTIVLDHPLLMGVDERKYPERLNYQALDLGEQLDLFAALRRHATRILRLQPAATWQRTAVHSETGLVNLRQLVQQATRHARHHLPFIAEKRAAIDPDVTYLTDRDRDIFLSIVDDPDPPPNAALMKAAEDYKRRHAQE